MITALVIVGVIALVVYAIGLGGTAAAIIHAAPWNAQHYSHHRDGRFETFRDHPVRNVFGIALNAAIWPALALRIFVREL